MNYYQIGKSIETRFRTMGYNIKYISRKSWAIFYIDDEFLFCTDLSILPKSQVTEILLELLKEKPNVCLPAKNGQKSAIYSD